jgi:hypothetical protein
MAHAPFPFPGGEAQECPFVAAVLHPAFQKGLVTAAIIGFQCQYFQGFSHFFIYTFSTASLLLWKATRLTSLFWQEAFRYGFDKIFSVKKAMYQSNLQLYYNIMPGVCKIMG